MGEPGQEGRTAVTTVMTVLCLAAIAFNVRFLVALCKERDGNANNQLFERQADGLNVSCSPGKLDNTDQSEKG